MAATAGESGRASRETMSAFANWSMSRGSGRSTVAVVDFPAPGRARRLSRVRLPQSPARRTVAQRPSNKGEDFLTEPGLIQWNPGFYVNSLNLSANDKGRSMTCPTTMRSLGDTLMGLLDLFGLGLGFFVGIFLVFLLVLKAMAEGGAL